MCEIKQLLVQLHQQVDRNVLQIGFRANYIITELLEPNLCFATSITKGKYPDKDKR